MSMFAIVHCPEELPRACGEISDFLALRQRRRSGLRCEALIGIWVDPDLAPESATRLQEKAPAASAGLGQITEFISLGAVWTLFCTASEQACRPCLVAGLQKVSSGEPTAVSFAPVFGSDLSRSEVDSELRQLRRHSPALLRPPLYQDGDTGRIVLPMDYRS